MSRKKFGFEGLWTAWGEVSGVDGLLDRFISIVALFLGMIRLHFMGMHCKYSLDNKA